MARWLTKLLLRVHELAVEDKIRLTYKAQHEAALLGLAPADVREVLAALTARDCAARLSSRLTGEWLYVFRPIVEGRIVYVKLAIRGDCVVVSFHEDEGGGDEEDDQ